MHESIKDINVEETLAALSLEEKISLLSGSGIWDTASLPNHGIPSVRCTDGPNGARGSRYFNPVPALCIPCGTGLGATWNPELIRRAGELLSRECEAKGAHVWLGPTVNIVRGPLNGRGFESFSEDPYLGGILAGEIIRGVQSRGTSAALKHFVANDQETQKMTVDVRMSERALREVYLKPFQMAIKNGDPKILMTSYNKVNGTHVSENSPMLQDIVRKDWAFDGLVMSDWFGVYSCAESINAGVDLEMPGPSHLRSQAADQVRAGKIKMETIDERACQVLNFLNYATKAPVSEKETSRDTPEDRELNRRLAGESVVLLKNSGGLLPIDPATCDEVAIIGPNAKLAMACGGGSASLRPYYTSSVFQGLRDQLPENTKVHYEPGVFGHVLLPVLTFEHVTNDAGDPGVSIELFHEPASTPDRRPFDSHTLPDTTYQLMDYWHPEMKDPFYISMRANYVAEYDGVHDFGLAVYGVAKLYIDDELIIDNETSQTPGGMFFGKGTVEVRGAYDMKAGQSYTLRVEAGSAALSKVETPNSMAIPGGALRLGGCNTSLSSRASTPISRRRAKTATPCRCLPTSTPSSRPSSRRTPTPSLLRRRVTPSRCRGETGPRRCCIAGTEVTRPVTLWRTWSLARLTPAGSCPSRSRLGWKTGRVSSVLGPTTCLFTMPRTFSSAIAGLRPGGSKLRFRLVMASATRPSRHPTWRYRIRKPRSPLKTQDHGPARRFSVSTSRTRASPASSDRYGRWAGSGKCSWSPARRSGWRCRWIGTARRCGTRRRGRGAWRLASMRLRWRPARGRRRLRGCLQWERICSGLVC
ncbi:glycoside hydrolase family 3 protein, partial [Sodiomyces alcalophilus JCM 7366]|uniref:glycoside hydrolase family 3 protein n=1 Tax=Sodiomyces alcalophilus JCM 7366 TaxID=591952 RepID=UPI0039B65305